MRLEKQQRQRLIRTPFKRKEDGGQVGKEAKATAASFLFMAEYIACIHHISPSFTDAHSGCFHFLVSGYYEYCFL
jgi:hypothetical protein